MKETTPSKTRKEKKDMKKFKMVEAPMNLVTMPQGWLICYAMSGDFNHDMGLGKLMNDTFHLTQKVDEDLEAGTTKIVGNVAAIIVKENCYDRVDTTYLRDAIRDLREQCEAGGIDLVAMPKICTGGNGLRWKEVKRIIKDEFAGSKIFMMICDR